MWIEESLFIVESGALCPALTPPPSLSVCSQQENNGALELCVCDLHDMRAQLSSIFSASKSPSLSFMPLKARSPLPLFLSLPLSLLFPPSCFIFVVNMLQDPECKVTVFQASSWDFSPPFPLTLSEQTKKKKKKKSTFLSAFHPLVEINRRSTAA